jgi:RNA polymerase subunit RPABC4/transcription elongation factor Spt4
VTEANHNPEQGAPPASPVETATACHYCGTALPERAETCPSCRQRQRRICSCGTVIGLELERCPTCGAEAATKIKMRRRSRSAHVKPRTLLRSALTGALVTVTATAILNLIISAMADRSMPAGLNATGIGVRLYYAGRTLYDGFSLLFTRLLGGGGPLLVAAVAGAVLGTTFYLVKTGYLGKRKHTHSTSRRRRSR